MPDFPPCEIDHCTHQASRHGGGFCHMHEQRYALCGRPIGDDFVKWCDVGGPTPRRWRAMQPDAEPEALRHCREILTRQRDKLRRELQEVERALRGIEAAREMLGEMERAAA